MMKTASGKRYADTRLTKFLSRRILELRPGKTQIEIAAAAGFTAVHMLAMIKAGAARLPLDRVPSLAKALETDPARLLLLAIEQQDRALAMVITDILGAVVSKNEIAWLEEIRDASGHSDPNLTRKAQQSIRRIFGK